MLILFIENTGTVKVNQMKFVKRISLFFIYPITMFGLGFVSNMAIQEYFYPGQQENRELADRATQI